MPLQSGLNHNIARPVCRFHAMENRIFQQRLQQQLRSFRIIRRIVMPLHLNPAVPHTDLLDSDILLRPFDFLPQCAVLAAVAQLGAEQVGQVFQQGFGIIRPQTYQADGGIEAVKQKMRTDTRR